MHSSSKLRGKDFNLKLYEKEISHSNFFSNFKKTDRLGILASERFEGAGAITLIMAYVTAFFDRCRSETNAFFAYPDFFTFQQKKPVADYGMFDIWPKQKNVFISGGTLETTTAITDYGINVLLVPEAEETVYISSKSNSRGKINRYFTYSPSGQVYEANLKISCEKILLQNWALSMFDSVPNNDSKFYRHQWLEKVDNKPILEQTFTEIRMPR